MAYGGALLRRWWQHRVGSNPTPSAEGTKQCGHGVRTHVIFAEDHRVGSSRATEWAWNESWGLFGETTERKRGSSHSLHERDGFVPFRGTKGRGRVAEWLKAHDWKSCGLTPAWVRIPPRPLLVLLLEWVLVWDPNPRNANAKHSHSKGG